MLFFPVVQTLASVLTLPRDISLGLNFWKATSTVNGWMNKGYTIHQPFDEHVREHPQKIAVWFEEEAWTFKQIQDYSLQIANYFKGEGYQAGDTVGLLMNNHPRYIAIWLGLSRLGVITALINTAVKGESLNQALTKAAQCKGFICSSEHLNVLISLQKSPDKLPEDMKIYITSSEKKISAENDEDMLKDFIQMDSFVSQSPKNQVNEITKTLNLTNKMAYIYTSGTEGMPKAAAWNFKRFAFLVVSIHTFLGIRKNDVIYTPMPLYHASGGLVGSGQMILFGNTMVIRGKFSASNYFSDCKKYGVTVGQYIGEMCSYIYQTKPNEADTDHKVRLMFGNGMRRNLWKDFKKRFKIRKIGEFYGSTEGNTNMVNTNNKEGAVGFIPPYAGFIYPVDLIEYEEDTGKEKRDPKTGLCIRARKKGLLVGGIKQSASSRFEGYADKKATEKKIIKDVFKKGDMYFNSGDVLERDIWGYYYFVDRLGDTYRWKGENIAASQVESIIQKGTNISPSSLAVYGVQIEGQDGKCGMAAFALSDTELDLKLLAKVAKENMTPQQVPVFLRFTKIPTTSTQKIQKAQLKKEGWDPEVINANRQSNPDKLYFFNLKTSSYEELTPEVKRKILSKEIKV